MRRFAVVAIALVGPAMIAGCGGSSSHHSPPPARPGPLQAEATVKQFLYHARVRSRDCPRLWAPSAQHRCAVALRELLQARRRGAVPRVPASEYSEESEDATGMITILVGNSHPTPPNPPDMNALFQLRLFAGTWKILLLTAG